MKGSMTIEAALVLPLVLLVIMWTLQAGMNLYQQAVETAMQEWPDAQQAISEFRDYFVIKDMLP